MWNKFLPNLEDANLEGWIETLEDLDLSSHSRCLPGHGEVCGGSEIGAFLQYLRSVKERLWAMEKQGSKEDLEKQRSCFEIPGTEDWRLRSIIEYNVSALFHPTSRAYSK